MVEAQSIEYRVSPPLSNDELNELFATAWPQHESGDFQPILRHSLAYIAAYSGEQLVGFVNLAWDGGIHAFLLDTTVHADFQHRGIGSRLIERAAAVAAERGIRWLHVDYEPHLQRFYRRCGFQHTEAGLLALP